MKIKDYKPTSLETNFRNKFEKVIWKIIQTAGTKLIFDYDTKAFTRNTRRIFGNKEIVGMEIGVCHGDNAVDMLRKLNFKKLYLIDAFQIYDDYSSIAPGNTQKYYDVEYQKLLKRMKHYGEKVEILKMMSNKAHTLFVDESLDCLYLDVMHNEKAIIEDFYNWYPKVKIGGIFGGHGFSACYSLFMGLTKICKKHDLRVSGFDYDFWIVKNSKLILKKKEG